MLFLHYMKSMPREMLLYLVVYLMIIIFYLCHFVEILLYQPSKLWTIYWMPFLVFADQNQKFTDSLYSVTVDCEFEIWYRGIPILTQ